MQISKASMDAAVKSGIIDSAQGERLFAFFREREKHTSAFTFVNVLYYLGGLVAITGMSLYVTLAFETLSGLQLAGIAATVMVVSIFGGFASQQQGNLVPAGILATLAVVVTPLLVYGLQKHFGYWVFAGDRGGPASYRAYHMFVDDRWLVMEIATLAMAVVALSFFRLPFLVMPVSVTLWYMCMDIAMRMTQYDENTFSFYQIYQHTSIWYGLVVCAFALIVDAYTRASEKDFAFWLYLSGLVTFWGALTSMDSSSELAKLAYGGMNVFMILLGGALSRRVVSVFGAAGLALYMGHLASKLFADAIMFPIACVGIGFIIMGVAYVWSKNEERINAFLRSLIMIPAFQKERTRTA